VVENRVECCSDAAGLDGGFVDMLVEHRLDRVLPAYVLAVNPNVFDV